MPSGGSRKLLIGMLLTASVLGGCSYLDMVRRLKVAEMSQKTNPSQLAEREISPERCIDIYGKIKSEEDFSSPLLVVAFSYRYGKQELVDHRQLNKLGYYTLYLPIGQYQVYVFADINGNKKFENTECVGYYKEGPMLDVETDDSSRTVLAHVDINVSKENCTELDIPFSFGVVEPEHEESDYYPSGSLRSLDDEIFSKEYGQMGLYDPAKFLRETSCMYFYAIHERDFSKIPVIFVHGITGTPKDWSYIVEQLDTTRFDPWFFYYPSGIGLEKLADVFYEIFLSGNITNIQQEEMILVAHSMGGIISKAAIDKYCRRKESDFLHLYISLCTPYGGNESAASGIDNAPVVVPSWRDIATNSSFIKRLYETEFPDDVEFYLLFGFRNNHQIKLGENSDGVISLGSQLDYRVQSQATSVYGYNETHNSILVSSRVSERLNRLLEDYKRRIPVDDVKAMYRE